MPADYCLPAAVCPACARARTGHAPHLIELQGVPATIRKEMHAIVLRVGAAESSTHPQERIVGIGAGPSFTIATTGTHIARRLLSAMRRAFKGRLRRNIATDTRTVLGWSIDGSERKDNS